MFKKLVVLFLFASLLNANESIDKDKIQRMIAQMVVLGFKGETVTSNDQIYKDVKSGLGGVILFDKDPTNKAKVKNINNPTQLKKLTNQLQKINDKKLLIAIDQEGGIVQRMKSSNGFSDTLKAKDISLKGIAFAKESYKNLATMLNENGVNLNFAPVVDLSINKDNKVIYKLGRSYGENPRKVTQYATIFVDELKKQDVISVLKHFPGHGSSLADSHQGFVDITKTWDKKELEPYKEFIKNNKVDMIMTAHVYNKNLDYRHPATLSYNVNTKLLRKELGYKGVLITDDLQMYAISKHYDLRETLKLAINSGVNMLLFANQQAKEISLKQIVDTVYSLILSEEVSLNKIIDSNNKIRTLL